MEGENYNSAYNSLISLVKTVADKKFKKIEKNLKMPYLQFMYTKLDLKDGQINVLTSPFKCIL